MAAALAQTPPTDPYTAPYADPAPISGGTTSFVPQWMSVGGSQVDAKWGFENFVPRVGVQHRSQGYGYDSGYTSFDTFIPLYQEDFARLTALQGSILVDNYGDVGFVAGLVQRRYVESLERVVGVNTFYNHREQGGNDFHQFGFGVETLGNFLDWRANGYIPVGDDFEIPESGGGVTEAFFSNRSILVNFIADKPLTGIDSEVGGIIPGSLDIFRAYVGMYHFWGPYSETATGVQGRFEARMRDAGVASVAVTNDGLFGTNVVFGIGFWLPGTNPRNTSPYGRAAARMAEDVVRNQNIVIDRSATTEPVAARWESGTVIDVIHVNGNAVAPGLGTPNLPVQTLQEAENLGQPESLIFVHANSQYNNEDVILQDGQYLLGEGVEHQIQSLYGRFLLPTVTPPEDIAAVPQIIASPGTAITLNDGNVVSGFNILGAGGTGISGTNVTDATLSRLNITGAAGDGIELLNADGELHITDNFLTGNGGKGIEISTSTAALDNEITITDNTILGQPEEGLELTTNGESVNRLVIEENLIRVSLGPTDTRNVPLIELTTNDSSRLAARIEDNDVEDSYNRTQASPTEDPYYHQLVVNATENSRIDVGLINNRFVSDRRTFQDNPRNGSFGFDLNSFDLSVLRARLDTNSSSLNYAFSENFISTFQLEDTLSTNTGTLFYFPTANFFDTLPAGTLVLP
jgi:hypothetical protein